METGVDPKQMKKGEKCSYIKTTGMGLLKPGRTHIIYLRYSLHRGQFADEPEVAMDLTQL